MPQSPQLSGSVWKFTQATRLRPPPPPTMQVSGVGAVHPVVAGRHFPPWHSSPTAQIFPQPPQASGFEVVSTHCVRVPPAPPVIMQLVRPVRQTQAPPVQVWLVPQRVPHWPQLRASVCVSTQVPPQLVVPLPQPSHRPLLQVVPAVQFAFVTHWTHRLVAVSQ